MTRSLRTGTLRGSRGPRWLARAGCALGLVTALGACATDLDTTRVTPRRGSLGQEMYTLVCDRVGAQALREDVTGASFHAVCHADAAGKFADRVDLSKLVPLEKGARNVAGTVVPLDEQHARRGYRVARIEALARRRDDLIRALDAAFPDQPIPTKRLGDGDGPASCEPGGDAQLPRALGDVLGRLTDLENDGTLPLLTRALGDVLEHVQSTPETQAALARLDARQGYRPAGIALGVARPILAYPRLVELTRSLLQVVASDSAPLDVGTRRDPARPFSNDNRTPVPGRAAGELQALFAVMREELRTAEPTAPPPALVGAPDPLLGARVALSRPRTTLELARHLLLREDPAFVSKLETASVQYVTRRDTRGFAAVALVGNQVPPPFLDQVGPSGVGADGLPDVGPLGQFITTEPVASPFFAANGAVGPRDAEGRALGPSGAPLYETLESNRTLLASLGQDLRPLLDPDPARDRDALMKAAGVATVLFGARDEAPSATRTYAPDPSLTKDWALTHASDPPRSLGTEAVVLRYRGFHPETSPLIDLVHAVGQVLADPAVDDTLELGRRLAAEHPRELARLVGVGLKIKELADAHPEASLPAASTLWDELLDVLAKIAREPGILEDLVRAFTRDETVKLQEVFANYSEFRDELTYDRKNLNGPAWNLTTNSAASFQTPVDRAKPDTGNNRSALQRFMQALHDANGLAACTKEDAIAHVQIIWPYPGGVKVQLDYPTNLLAKTVCVFLGSQAPSRLRQCGVLRFENVAELLLKVALDRFPLDVRDDCLDKMMKSPLTDLVGGADLFLERTSGIKGLSTRPTVPGISRMVFFDAAHDGLAGDTTRRDPDTNRFLRDLLDPVPSMVCPATPFTDPSDGKVLQLRQCASFADTLRGRDNNALFPLEKYDFIRNVQALAAAFDDHNKPLLFVELFDTLHRHWGSAAQPKDVCDPARPRSDARWCSQDGASSYEPLLVEVFRKTDLFQALQDTLPVLESVKIPRCAITDPKTGRCLKLGATRSGVEVLVDLVRIMVDPERNKGLTDAHGNTFAVRNDGTKNPQTTPLLLLIDAMKGIDAAFAAAPDGPARQTEWRKARSQLVDALFGVKGTGKATTWANPATAAVLPTLLETTSSQVLARCRDRSPGARCAWARDELRQSASETVGGPTFAATLDLVEALRRDPSARVELQRLLQYLLDPASENDAHASTLAAMLDGLQVMSDDTNLAPVYTALSSAVAPRLVDDSGKVVRRGLADAAVESLTRVFAEARDAEGREVCGQEIDPNRVLAIALRRLMTPPQPNQPAPLEVLIDVVADVNRADPTLTEKLEGRDYANIAAELRGFLLDKGSGLEQVYEVIRQATANP